MKKLALSILLLFAAAMGAARWAEAGPEPSVGLFWYETVDPTVAPGVCAPQWQLLIRTDVPSLYAHTGTSCTAWLLIAGGSGGGTVTDVTCGTGLSCTPNPIVSTGTVALDINGGVTQTCSANQAVTSMTSAGIQSCTAFTPSGSISGTTNHIAAFASSTTVGNAAGGATDNGTTFTVPDAVFAATTQAQLGNLNEAILSPSAISGTTNDWSPTGWTGKTTTIIEVSLSAAATLDGLAALNAGSIVSLCNTSGSFDLAIQEESAGSLAANRFTIGGNGASSYVLAHHTGPEIQCATFYYGSSLAHWISLGTTSGTLPSLVLQSGLSVQSSGASIAGGLSVTLAQSAATSGTSASSVSDASSYNTTAGAIQATGFNCSNTSTRSSGANALTNVCGQFTSSGAQTNDALVTLAGNNIFNQSSGTSTFDGNLIMGAAGAVIELIQASGSSATPKLTAFAGNPNGTVSGTAGDLLLDTSTPAIWQSTGGTGWAQGGGGGSVIGSGTSPDITVWNGTNSITNFAGSTSNTCSAGNFATALAMSTSGGLTLTCASAGTSGVTGTGTAGNLTEWATTSSVQNAPITDSGTGTLSTTDALSAGGSLFLTGKQADTSTGTQNNFSITIGSSGTTVLRSSPATALTYTGFSCGGSTCTSADDGIVLVVYNTSSTTVTFSAESASSNAGNRFWIQGGTPALTLSGNASDGNTGAVFVYDGTSTRWRLVASNIIAWSQGVTFASSVTASGTASNPLILSTSTTIQASGTGVTLACNGSGGATTCQSNSCNNTGGTFSTTNTGASSCTVTWNGSPAHAPSCNVTAQTAISALGYSETSTALTITATTITTSDNIDYICIFH